MKLFGVLALLMAVCLGTLMAASSQSEAAGTEDQVDPAITAEISQLEGRVAEWQISA